MSIHQARMIRANELYSCVHDIIQTAISLETLAEHMFDAMPGEAHIINVLAKRLEEATTDLDQFHHRLSMKATEQVGRADRLRVVHPQA